MQELTLANAEQYLRDRGWIGPGPVDVAPLSGGVSNLVLRVDAGGERFVVKQSRPQLRTRDAWFSDVDRIHRELEVMQALEDVLPPPTVPRVLRVDRANFVFAMSHAPPAIVWKESLLAGQIDLAMGTRVGMVLGAMHEASARLRTRFEPFAKRAAFQQLRIEPFYQRVQGRRPEVAAALQTLVDEMLTRADALCHGDYTPKNILVHDQGFTLVDYETAHFGDPTMDVGLLLTHMLLKAVHRPALREGYAELIRRCWSAYRASIGCRAEGDWERRGVAHWGACLLARVDGASPADYLVGDEPRREVVRRIGRAVLLDGITTLESVLELAARELTTLPQRAGGSGGGSTPGIVGI